MRVHVGAVPVQAPLHPVNFIPASGVAVRVTLVLAVTPAEQAAPQLIAPSDDVTVPPADFVTVTMGEKNTVTDQVDETVHEVAVAVPGLGQALPHFTDQPSAGVAVIVTGTPPGIATTLLLHPAPQFMPPTLDVTVPEPCLLTVNVGIFTNHTVVD